MMILEEDPPLDVHTQVEADFKNTPPKAAIGLSEAEEGLLLVPVDPQAEMSPLAVACSMQRVRVGHSLFRRGRWYRRIVTFDVESGEILGVTWLPDADAANDHP